MAVYTKLDHESIEKILSNYSIGRLDKFEDIEEGIENSNFLIWVNRGSPLFFRFNDFIESV